MVGIKINPPTTGDAEADDDDERRDRARAMMNTCAHTIITHSRDRDRVAARRQPRRRRAENPKRYARRASVAIRSPPTRATTRARARRRARTNARATKTCEEYSSRILRRARGVTQRSRPTRSAPAPARGMIIRAPGPPDSTRARASSSSNVALCEYVLVAVRLPDHHGLGVGDLAGGHGDGLGDLRGGLGDGRHGYVK